MWTLNQLNEILHNVAVFPNYDSALAQNRLIKNENVKSEEHEKKFNDVKKTMDFFFSIFPTEVLENSGNKFCTLSVSSAKSSKSRLFNLDGNALESIEIRNLFNGKIIARDFTYLEEIYENWNSLWQGRRKKDLSSLTWEEQQAEKSVYDYIIDILFSEKNLIVRPGNKRTDYENVILEELRETEDAAIILTVVTAMAFIFYDVYSEATITGLLNFVHRKENKVSTPLKNEMDAYYTSLWNEYKNYYLDKHNKNDDELNNGILLSEVYVLPSLTNTTGKKWTLEELSNKGPLRKLIQAPNSYGKTVFMNSIVVSMVYTKLKRKDDSTEKNRMKEGSDENNQSKKLEDLRKFHGISGDFIPIILEPRRLEKESAPLIELNDYIKWIYKAVISGISEECFCNLVVQKKTQILFLFDGYDEVSKSVKQEVDNLIDELIKQNYSIIITSRPMEFKFGGFDCYRIEKADMKKVEALMKNLQAKINVPEEVSEQSMSEMLQIMQTNTYLQKLTVSPYMIVKVMVKCCNGIVKKNDLKINRVIDELLKNLAKRQANKKALDLSLAFEIYEEIAFQMVKRNSLLLEEQNIHGIIADLMQGDNFSEDDYFSQRLRIKQTESEIATSIYNDIMINIGLLEGRGENVEFLSSLFALEFAARKMMRILSYSSDMNEFWEEYELIIPEYAGDIMVMFLTILWDKVVNRYYAEVPRLNRKLNRKEVVLEVLNHAFMEKEKMLAGTIQDLVTQNYGDNCFSSNDEEYQQIKKDLEEHIKRK